jgi:hypothetical protein
MVLYYASICFYFGDLTFLLFVIFPDPDVPHFLTADEQKPESARAPAGDNAEVRNGCN